MIDNDLDLLVSFRSEVPLADAETAERVYRRATTTRPSWRVLLHARLSRRTRVALAVGLAGLVLVPAAVAVGSKIADLFEGTPAPPAVSTSFTAFNTMADLSTQQGFAKNAPHADVSKAHGVIEIQTADGPEDLWAAPTDDGGTCYFIDFANDPPRPTGKLGFGGCNPSPPPASNISWGDDWVISHPDLLTFSGSVFVDAATVRATLADGSTVTLPVVEGLFVGSLDNGAKVTQITAYDTAGKQVAQWVSPS